MENRSDYLMKDNLCEKAIEDFKQSSFVLDWLNQYAELYNSVTIKPEGLPRITLSHFDGENFENIQKFAKLYKSVLSEFE